MADRSLADQLATAEREMAADEARYTEALQSMARAMATRNAARETLNASRDVAQSLRGQAEAEAALKNVNPDLLRLIDQAEADLAAATAKVDPARGDWAAAYHRYHGKTFPSPRAQQHAKERVAALRDLLNQRESEWSRASARLIGLQLQRDAAMRAARARLNAETEATQRAADQERRRAAADRVVEREARH